MCDERRREVPGRLPGKLGKSAREPVTTLLSSHPSLRIEIWVMRSIGRSPTQIDYAITRNENASWFSIFYFCNASCRATNSEELTACGLLCDAPGNEAQAHVIRRPVPFLIVQSSSKQVAALCDYGFSLRFRNALEHASAKCAQPPVHSTFRQRRGARNQLQSAPPQIRGARAGAL